MRVPLACLPLLLSLLLSGSVSAVDFESVPYAPLGVGAFWQYREPSGDLVTRTVTGTEVLASGETYRIVDTGGGLTGYTEFVTNDAAGLRLHRTIDPSHGGATMTFSPPALLAPLFGDVGDDALGQGTVEIVDAAQTYEYPYSCETSLSNSVFSGFDLGYLHGIEVTVRLSVLGTTPSYQPPYSWPYINFTRWDWYARDLGVIFFTHAVGGEWSVSGAIVETNVPEPPADPVAALALIALAACARRRFSAV